MSHFLVIDNSYWSNLEPDISHSLFPQGHTVTERHVIILSHVHSHKAKSVLAVTAI